MASDVFPQTITTWLNVELSKGLVGRESVNQYLMGTYKMPLRVYFLGTDSRWLGEPDEVIHGFFASRLGKEDYLEKWQASGKRLRYWLINGFNFYLKELRRERRRDSRQSMELPDLVDPEDMTNQLDTAASKSFVRQAMDDSRRTCAERDMADHWSIFLMHHLDDLPYATIATTFDVTPARAAVMARTAARVFRRTLRDVLIRDGAPEEDVDHEIRSLLEVLSR